jgi:hypothetical protein
MPHKKEIPPHVEAAIAASKSGGKSGAKGGKGAHGYSKEKTAREAAAMDAGMKSGDGKAENQSEE